MKTCSTCHATKPLESFARHQVAPQGRRPSCKDCANKYERIKYAQTLSAIQALKAVPCADCVKTYPAVVMDFDHVRGEKSFNLSKAANRFSWEVVMAEVAKCDVVCANCHRIRTAARRAK